MHLVDLSSLSKYDKYKYLKNAVDTLSRYAGCVTLKDKTGTSNTSALKSLFRNRKQITIQFFNGPEIVNATVQQYLKRQGVNFDKTRNPDIKGAVIEHLTI